MVFKAYTTQGGENLILVNLDHVTSILPLFNGDGVCGSVIQMTDGRSYQVLDLVEDMITIPGQVEFL